VFRHRGTAAAGIAALAALGIGALLQFTASKGLPMFLWPPPHLWLGTFAADFMLAVMLAAVAGTMLRPGTRRVMGSIVIAEIAWWGIPACAGAVGLTLSIARQRVEVNWLVFLGTAVGAVAAPAAAWATASLKPRAHRCAAASQSCRRGDPIDIRTSPLCESTRRDA